MSINSLIYRNLKKNIQNYFLYVFALIFSVALYFAFVTLQYDPAMGALKGSVKGSAAIQAASVLLVAIVAIFLLYANNIFIKRRSKEIGLFQLIGMTKGKIFSILTLENLMLYFGSMLVGIFVGFLASKLVLMILFKITDVETEVVLQFSIEALIQTVIIFAAVYVLIMIMNYTFIKRQNILSLFRVDSTTQEKVKKMSILEILMGLAGIGLIFYGYFTSTQLFNGDYNSDELFRAMTIILATVIIGTYLFYKGSVSFIFNMIRKSKDGYLSLNEVLSLSSIMFRMKSNAFLLTIITTVSALAIGLLSLSYISYYSAEKSAKQYVPNDFVFSFKEQKDQFTEALSAQRIDYDEVHRNVLQVEVDVSHIVGSSKVDGNKTMVLSVVSDKEVEHIDLSPEETLFTGANDVMDNMIELKKTGDIALKGKEISIQQKLIDTTKETVISMYLSLGLPVAIVDDSIYQQLAGDLNLKIQKDISDYFGIDIQDENKMEKANEIFLGLDLGEESQASSQSILMIEQKANMGLVMFIVGFLGLTFLITSGCILYFKQMDEAEEERGNYTILRKLGFTQGDLLRGIQGKQLFNFGIPLIVGLSHSYFAVKSGWFFFGTELWTPMIIVMLLYTGLYSIFGLLSVLFYKKVIKEAL
ncbi:ABC transporter permease [Paenibacillus faecalis]|uniref:ABC transporter permease n=1 Tax=Paenibacillus faecalis TaxID=2079532 RepID=UPI000D0F28FB|nr:ABC transporter permease [Paenibacillus faecalis]